MPQSGHAASSTSTESGSGAYQRSIGARFAAPRNDLSEREVEIIELVATGLTNQEIAEALTISKRTVDNHVSNIFTKTGAKNRVALLNWAMDKGKICRDGFNCCTLAPGAPEGGMGTAGTPLRPPSTRREGG
jgi:DNA-binding NarL/FixJ family response regulator